MGGNDIAVHRMKATLCRTVDPDGVVPRVEGSAGLAVATLINAAGHKGCALRVELTLPVGLLLRSRETLTGGYRNGVTTGAEVK